jgi:predicted transcriptional regulator
MELTTSQRRMLWYCVTQSPVSLEQLAEWIGKPKGALRTVMTSLVTKGLIVADPDSLAAFIPTLQGIDEHHNCIDNAMRTDSHECMRLERAAEQRRESRLAAA